MDRLMFFSYLLMGLLGWKREVEKLKAGGGN